MSLKAHRHAIPLCALVSCMQTGSAFQLYGVQQISWQAFDLSCWLKSHQRVEPQSSRALIVSTRSQVPSGANAVKSLPRQGSHVSKDAAGAA